VVAKAELAFGGESLRLHYLSVPPSAALSAVRLLGEAGLVERSRIIMEKPFGTDLASAVSLNAKLHEVFKDDQIFRIDHFLGKEPAQNILAFRFANGLFEPIWNRNFIDHVQIDVPETLGLGTRSGFYESVGAYRDMVVTHLFQILAFMAMEPPTALAPAPISEEKNKVFRSMLPIMPSDVVRGQYTGYRSEEGVDPESETETFIALKCSIDNWRWVGVPFYLRTGKRLAEGQRIISIAFREPPKSMFPAGSGVGAKGPDYLTFDLADSAKTGGIDAVAESTAARASLRAGLMGAECDSSAGRTACLASAVRAGLARPQSPRQLMRSKRMAPRSWLTSAAHGSCNLRSKHRNTDHQAYLWR
jgi:glucose-6-phosphate 1-dehydrogenase